ncbi:MAG: TonB-dependent receptor [Pseudomonadales bacterium]|nr:TonB-dependent receptor [Pseudomonadales bacterium]
MEDRVTAMTKSIIIGLLAFPSIYFPTTVVADELNALQKEIRWLQEETFVTTATKTVENINKSGASVSVITANDLQKMGARNLMDALKRVPGLGIHYTNIGLPTIEVRGVKTDFSEKVLVLINGHPTNNNIINGGALWNMRNIAIGDIAHVEVVRGPGSALYGANAFVAIVNIITKTGSEIKGIETSAALGNNQTKTLNLLYGQQSESFELAANLHYFDTNGIDEYVKSDALGNAGDTYSWEENYEFGFNLSAGKFSAQGKYIQQKAGPHVGAANALNNESVVDGTEYFLELAYKDDLNKIINYEVKLYHDTFDSDNYWELYPEGAFDGAFPNGFLANSPAKVERTGSEAQFNFQLNANNKLIAGVMAEHQTQYEVRHFTNFNPTDGSPLGGGYQDISDRWNWNGSHNRDVSALFIQDIWDVHDSVRLIMGARYDRYSDFGNSLNPRSSITWEFINDFNLVALYGSAFRAPTFGELYNINNPFQLGNPDLDPEEIKTKEIAINGKLDKRSRFKVAAFHNDISDLITTVSAVSENSGKVRVTGMETEFQTRLSNGSSFNVNYTYQHSINRLTDERAPDVPLHKANGAFNYYHSKQLNVYLAFVYRGKIERPGGDTRASINEAVTFDTASTWSNAAGNLEIQLSIYNLFDENYVDASAAGSMESDFPRAGRSYTLKGTYKL